MKGLFYFILVAFIFSACKKAKFEGEDCKYKCFVLSGDITEFGNANPISNAEVLITAKKKKNTKFIVSTKTDDNGHWKVSFDAGYIENLKEGYLRIERKNYLYKKERIYFNIDSVDQEQSYQTQLHKTAEIYYQLTINNAEIKRVESRFEFENQGFKELKYTNKEVPATVSFRQTIPAGQNVNLKLFTSLEENSSGENDWQAVLGFPILVNVPANETDTIRVEFN